MRRVALALALVACGAPPAAAPRPVPEPLPESPAGIDRAVIAAELATLFALSERACTCQDEPCIAAVDEDLGGFYRVATMNDPVTEIETWPEDLDAMASVALMRLIACMDELDHTSTARRVGIVRKHEAVRDAACRCHDAACTRRIVEVFEDLAKIGLTAQWIDDDTRAEVYRIDVEARACVAGPLAEQAILDAKAFRTEACACADAECAADVRGRFMAWAQRSMVGPEDHATLELLSEIVVEASACLAQVTSSP